MEKCYQEFFSEIKKLQARPLADIELKLSAICQKLVVAAVMKFKKSMEVILVEGAGWESQLESFAIEIEKRYQV